jgi:hypothetical protein
VYLAAAVAYYQYDSDRKKSTGWFGHPNRLRRCCQCDWFITWLWRCAVRVVDTAGKLRLGGPWQLTDADNKVRVTCLPRVCTLSHSRPRSRVRAKSLRASTHCSTLVGSALALLGAHDSPVFSGFTYCPDICPNELHKMGKALNIAGLSTLDVAAALASVFVL